MTKTDMIKCHLSTLMGTKKLKIVELARELGVHRSAITALYDETAKRVDMELLNKLCVYFECGVGDILEFIEEE